MTYTIGLLHPGSMGSAFGAQLRAAATSCCGVPTDAATQPAAGLSTRASKPRHCPSSFPAPTCCSPCALPQERRRPPPR